MKSACFLSLLFTDFCFVDCFFSNFMALFQFQFTNKGNLGIFYENMLILGLFFVRCASLYFYLIFLPIFYFVELSY